MSNKENSENKINYDLINLSVPEIIAALHQKAVKETDGSKCRVANSAIEQDGKNVRLASAGQHIISILPLKEEELIDKPFAIEQLKKYVAWFVGPDISNKVTDKTVLKLGNEDETAKTEENPEDEGEDLDDKPEEGKTEDTTEPEEDTTVSESIDVQSFRSFLLENYNIIIEDDSDSSAEPEEDDLTSSDKKTRKAAEAKEKAEKAKGYYIAYNLKVKGLKETNIKDAMKQFATKFFDELTITASGLFGGSQQIKGSDVRKQFHDLLHIDHEELAKNVEKYISLKFPNLENVDVKARDQNTLLREIEPQLDKSDITKTQNDALHKAAYTLWIKVKEENRQKPFLNKIKVAEIIRKCLGFFRIGKKMQVTKDSIIKIEDFVDKHDSQSIAANAKRITAAELKVDIDKAFGSKTELGNTEATALYVKIKKEFDKIKTLKNNKEKENLKAVEIFNDFSKKFGTLKKNKTIDKKIFTDFYTKYLNFEAGLNESISFQFISESYIANQILEMLFEDFNMKDIQPSELIEADNEEAKSEENPETSKAEIDYSQYDSEFKKIVSDRVKTASGKGVYSKDDAIEQLDIQYHNSISKISDSARNSFAVIDMSKDSDLNESVLTEADKSEIEKKRIELAFNDFKKKFSSTLSAESFDLYFMIETDKEEKEAEKKVDESITLNESKFNIDDIEDIITSKSIRLGRSVLPVPKGKKKNETKINYTVKVEPSKDIVDFIRSVEIGTEKEYKKILNRKYSALLIIKMPKDEGEIHHTGSIGSKAFLDDDVVKKEVFNKCFESDSDYDFYILTGTAKNNKNETVYFDDNSVNADVKFFIAAFDDDVEVKPPEPPTPPEPGEKLAGKAYVLPFDITGKNKPDETPDDDTPTLTPEPNDDNPDEFEGCDLYLYPITSSKDFEEQPEVGNN